MFTICVDPNASELFLFSPGDEETDEGVVLVERGKPTGKSARRLCSSRVRSGKILEPFLDKMDFGSFDCL